jgi:hypothetical protein
MTGSQVDNFHSVHPRDKGEAFLADLLADLLVALLAALSYRVGMNV